MRVSGIHLGTGGLDMYGWDITTTSTSYTTVDDATGFTLRTDETNPNAVVAVKRQKYIGSHSMTGKFTSSNIITANSMSSGISLVFFVNCYDSSNNYLNRVGLFVVFINIGSPVLINNYGATGNGTFATNQISNQVIGAALDTALTYTLTADTATKQWGWTCSDGYSVDGDALIGQLHASTAYIRFSVYEQINTGVTGIAELTAISFT